MLIPVQVDKIDTVIIGYGPGKNGLMAVVLWPLAAGGFGARDVRVSDLSFPRLPEKLQRFLRRQAKKIQRETHSVAD